MAALIRHVAKLQCLRSAGSILTTNNKTPLTEIVRTLKKPVKPQTRVLVRKFEWDGKSLAARGFLRPIKSYEPSPDVSDKLDTLCEKFELSKSDDTKLDDPIKRFKIFVAAEEEFNYSLPNSILHEIETIGDLRNFFTTPINASVPYDTIKNTDLPKNLHVLHNYHRFHPDEDTKFGGKTAFPRSSTLVTGLKYKKKYSGHYQKQTWPYQ